MAGIQASGRCGASLTSGFHDNRTRVAEASDAGRAGGRGGIRGSWGARGPRGLGRAGGHTRRHFLAGAGGAAGALALGGAGSAAAAPAGKRVAVLGGGVSGLSAAHELAERGYAVTVYEYYDALGGKARSMDVPGTAAGGRRPLPGEHGFRFFPGFYRNLPDTMRRIPFAGHPDGVRGNLRNGTEALFARGSGRPDLHFPLRRVTTPPAPGTLTPSWLRDQLLSVLDLGTRLPAHEAAYFVNRLLVHLTSCDARREDEWEKTPWWDFIRAERMSEEYRTLLGVGQTRNLVATRAEVASTRTVGRVIIEALLLWGLLGRGLDGPDADIDRVLNAPPPARPGSTPGRRTCAPSASRSCSAPRCGRCCTPAAA
ncbi:hypothetical protein GCM10020295_33640 [Streptomyces cinereospinus]